MEEKISVNEFKNGTTFLYNNVPHMVLESSHSKSGRGQAHVKTKCKNLQNSSIQQITFTGGDQVSFAYIDKKEMQFLYVTDNEATFMDNETFEQITIQLDNLKNELKFLIDGSKVYISMYQGSVLGIILDRNVSLEVSEAPDAVRGDTVTNATKKIVLETGLELDAPQFVKVGDKIVVSTETGKYVSKSNN